MKLLFYIPSMIAIYFILFFSRWKKHPEKGIVYTLFYIYICTVIILTILPLPETWNPDRFDGDYGNFIPFRDLKKGYGGAIKDIVLNIIMTVPLGILFPQVSKRRCVGTVLTGFLSSFTIEGMQLLMTVFGSRYHSFDITDVITNTAGTLIGYLIYKIIRITERSPENR